MRINFRDILEKIVFSIKWLLVPFYLKLFYGLILFLIKFWKGTIVTTDIVHVLEDIDIIMIANLVKMIVTGSYTSFVDKGHGEEEETSAGMLKVKMAGSLIGVSSIFMLKEFLENSDMSQAQLTKILLIHGSFLIGALILAVMDYLHEKSYTFHKED